MKKTITVGEHQVIVDVIQNPNGAIGFVATCGQVVKRGMINPLQIAHNHTEEQLRKDIDDYATILANEAAGHNQAVVLSKRIFGEPDGKSPASPEPASSVPAGPVPNAE
jgi:hypothetical protein